MNFPIPRHSVVSLVLVVLVALPAAAQLSPEYAGWADGPEGFLLTKKERNEWDKVATDAQAEEFIDLFWARRNPDPSAAFNSFRAEFEAKVRYADENFAYAGQRGALSDRAKVLILMGRPKGAQTRGPQQTLPPVGSRSGGSDDVEGSTQLWFYDPATLPEGFKMKGAELFFMFYEEQPGSNEYILDRSNRRAFKGLTALEKAPEVLLLHPGLKEVPKPVAIPGARRAPQELASWLESEAPFNDAVRVYSELGVSDGVHRPLWVHLELPADAPALERIAGRVSSPEGGVQSTFEVDAVALKGQYGAAYHLAIPLRRGQHELQIVGIADGAAQVTEAISAEVSEVPDEGTWMSQLELGVTAEANNAARLGDPFSFGGWQVMPLTGPDLARESELVYFGFIVRPGSDEQGAAALKAKIGLSREGRALGSPVTIPLEPMPLVGDLYWYGNSIPLSGLPEAGSYEIEFEIMDAAAGISVERALPIEITD